MTLTPTGEAGYGFTHRNTYTETGAGALNLRVEGQGAHSVTTGLGAALRAETVRGDLTILPEVSAMWLRDWGARRSRTVASFARAGSRFVTPGAPPAANAARLGLGVNLRARAGWNVSARYDGEFRAGRRAHGGSLTLRWAF